MEECFMNLTAHTENRKELVFIMNKFEYKTKNNGI
ncbi:hypothetical protein IMCC3317_24330 [Kordia antarctica]|uniref:Uncharacterized protein n=1 Tax=Kordia antarctica TaxID=1218801 RepID=A0A7L4ZK99_9FLAO|nr:hypothetical protein IMCC3317_24330 [Kordia antarctica]